jgi:CYTH domain-containing protein
VELESETQDVKLPGWLTPYLVREVTEEPGYVNLNLAR